MNPKGFQLLDLNTNGTPDDKIVFCKNPNGFQLLDKNKNGTPDNKIVFY